MAVLHLDRHYQSLPPGLQWPATLRTWPMVEIMSRSLLHATITSAPSNNVRQPINFMKREISSEYDNPSATVQISHPSRNPNVCHHFHRTSLLNSANRIQLTPCIYRNRRSCLRPFCILLCDVTTVHNVVSCTSITTNKRQAPVLDGNQFCLLRCKTLHVSDAYDHHQVVINIKMCQRLLLHCASYGSIGVSQVMYNQSVHDNII
jgi:hypothetical protein